MKTLREAAQQALEALDWIGCSPEGYDQMCDDRDRAQAALRAALAQPEPRNQCGETCERAKLCAVCARGLEEQEPAAKMHLFFEDNNGALRHTPEDCQAFGANGQPAAVYVGRQRYVPEQERADPAQPPCDIAEDGVCEVIDCCRKSPLILEALEIGYAAAQAEAAQYHAAMDADVAKIAAAITAVKAALAQEEQEPVLVVEQEPDYMSRGHFYEGSKPFIDPTEVWKLPIGTKLYTNPPRREWQSLSDEEIKTAVEASEDFWATSRGWITSVARAVEQALKEKNNG
jgi:hypothetical protein